jgi:hypothetical protein
MKRFYVLLYALGALLIGIFIFWRLAPTDLLHVILTAEIFAVLSCASGVLCLFVARQLRLEESEFVARTAAAARVEAEAAVRDQIDVLEAELAAARDYIRRMEP